MESTNDPQISSYDDLLSVFVEAEKPKEAWKIGPEFEKFGIYESTLAPIPYEGRHGVLRIFEALVEGHGWTAEREYDGGPVLSLKRGDGSITLEPGGQLELSGAAVSDVHKVCGEFRGHLTEISAISKELGIRWLGLGFHPFAKREDFSWVPKSRYPIMREYLPSRGAHALDMMLRTSTVQANYDFSSEKDAMRKMRVALALSPVSTAMFANSPWLEGKPHGGVTYRGRVWLDVDPDRTGLLPKLWEKGARYTDYVEWALDVPMFMFKRDGKAVANTGQSFRSFWKSGYQGHTARMSDWKGHMNTLFPEVRLKNTIEVRGADAQMTPMRCALPALWTGIFYDSRAMDEAEALTAEWTHDEVDALRPALWRLGLKSPFRGEPLVKVAERVLEIAEGGLERRGIKNSSGKDERVHLTRLKALIADGKSPADQLLEDVAGAPDMRRAIVEKSALL